MKLYYFKGPIDNFGDELNPWLLPKVFPGLFDEDESTLFLGVGSVIFDCHPELSQKIVFGSGFGGYSKLPVLDDRWTFYCVRGPRTAAFCGLDESRIAGDAAILLKNHRPAQRPPGRGVAFMPHWNSVARGNWKLACELAGVTFVDPSAPVEETLSIIEGSAMVIAEAMHFAIAADALRVPWVPLLPFHASHRMKWLDWAQPLEMNLKPYWFCPSTLREAYVALRGDGEGGPLGRTDGALGKVVQGVNWAFVRLAAARLSQLVKMPPVLSADTALARASERLEASAAEIARDFAPATRMAKHSFA